MAVNEREIVLDLLLNNKKQALKETLDGYLYLDKVKRSFITRLYEGTIEKRIYLDYIVDKFSKTSTDKLKPIIRILLENATYQIAFMDKVPDSAAINEAVKLVKKRGLVGLSGFVNGVLRNIARNKENIELPDKNKHLEKYYEIKYSMPAWIIKHLFAEYGKEKAESILEAFEHKRPLIAKVNVNKVSREELVKHLTDEGIKVNTDTIFEDSLKILELDSLAFLESFENGEFNIQDESSQFIGKIVKLTKGAKVLDLCAAPGGKSFLIAEKEEAEEITACDISEKKIGLIEENIARIGTRKIKTLVNDAAVFNPDFKSRFDLVICDLPCSGLGVIGRKRDIKYNVTEDKINELAALQKIILKNAMQYVKAGGHLIFSTCTMAKAENEENFNFISCHEGFVPVDFSAKIKKYLGDKNERLVKEAGNGYMRLIPGELCTDGFFISEFMREE